MFCYRISTHYTSAVLNLSDMWVELKPSPVAIVEENLLHKREDGEFKQHPMEGGQLQVEAAVVAILHEPVEDIAERDANHSLVEDHHQDGMLQLSSIHLPQRCDTINNTNIQFYYLVSFLLLLHAVMAM